MTANLTVCALWQKAGSPKLDDYEVLPQAFFSTSALAIERKF